MKREGLPLRVRTPFGKKRPPAGQARGQNLEKKTPLNDVDVSSSHAGTHFRDINRVGRCAISREEQFTRLGSAIKQEELVCACGSRCQSIQFGTTI